MCIRPSTAHAASATNSLEALLCAYPRSRSSKGYSNGSSREPQPGAKWHAEPTGAGQDICTSLNGRLNPDSSGHMSGSEVRYTPEMHTAMCGSGVPLAIDR